MSGVICDRRVPASVKGKVYKVAVRPAMLYGLETVALMKRQEAEMEVAELKMLRLSLGVTRMDKIRNEYIRGQHRWEGLERKHERQDWDSMVTYGGKMMVYWEKDAEVRVARKEEIGKAKNEVYGCSERTWLRLKWRRRIQKIETTGAGKSAVATPNGKSRKKKKNQWTKCTLKRHPVCFTARVCNCYYTASCRHYTNLAGAIAVNMDRKKCGTFSSFRLLSPDIYHINIMRNPNEVDVHWGRSATPKYTFF